MKVTLNGKIIEAEQGITYAQLAAQVQKGYEYDICLAFCGNELRPLTAVVEAGSNISFVTTNETLGAESYRRSLVLLTIRAFREIVKPEKLKSIKVLFSVNKGYYMEAAGDFTVNEELLGRVKFVMQRYVAANTPINRYNLGTSEAVKLFEKEGMNDKSRLFGYRRTGITNVYELDGFYDYFYGYMLPSCGILKVFDLIPYMNGFILQFPDAAAPSQLSFVDTPNVSKTLLDSTHWSDELGLSTVADLNDRIVDGSIKDIILVQEAVQNQKLANIASMIKERGNIKFVMIAGPSSSGKTTFSHRLSIQLKAQGLNPHPIGVDNYFIDRDFIPVGADGKRDYENLDVVDVELFGRQMNELLEGKEVELPSYNFVEGIKEYKGNKLKLSENDILIIEGIHCLNSQLYPDLPQERMFKIYISALTQLNVDEHNRVSTTDGRLIRRMVRDSRTRGNSATDTISRWASVRAGEEKNIFPYQESADVVFNSAQIYELSVLKPYAERILFSVPKDSKEYVEAKRLLKFLDYFLTLPAESIPFDSILREFVGGSVFDV